VSGTRDAICPDIQGRLANCALNKTIGCAAKQIVGRRLDWCACHVLNQLVTQRFRPTQRRIDGQEGAAFVFLEPTLDRLDGTTVATERCLAQLQASIGQET
jgi:hypothetical protein